MAGASRNFLCPMIIHANETRPAGFPVITDRPLLFDEHKAVCLKQSDQLVEFHRSPSCVSGPVEFFASLLEHHFGDFTGRGRLNQARLQASNSSASSFRFTAVKLSSSCSGRLAPTIAEVIPGCARIQAIATWTSDFPRA